MALTFYYILSIHIEDTVLLQKGLKTNLSPFARIAPFLSSNTRRLKPSRVRESRLRFLFHWHNLGTLFEFPEGKMMTLGPETMSPPTNM